MIRNRKCFFLETGLLVIKDILCLTMSMVPSSGVFIFKILIVFLILSWQLSCDSIFILYNFIISSPGSKCLFKLVKSKFPKSFANIYPRILIINQTHIFLRRSAQSKYQREILKIFNLISSYFITKSQILNLLSISFPMITLALFQTSIFKEKCLW